MPRLKVAILTVALAAGAVGADTTTAPSPQDLPAPVAMAPTYITIGKELLLRVAIIRQTLADLTLTDQVRRNAGQILDDVDKNVRQLLQSIESGNMPTYGTIMAVPQNMRAAHEKLLAAIGPDQSQLLEQKLRSLRGEARGQLDKLAQDVDDENLNGKTKDACDKLIACAQAEAEKLPDTDVEGDQYAADREEMDHLVAKVRDDVAKVVGPTEQTKADPTTQPAPRS